MSKKNIHDEKLFGHINKIINSREITIIVDNAERGYLPNFAYEKTDSLYYFIQNPANQFIDKDIQEKFLEFDTAFYTLSQPYALSSYADVVDAYPNLKLTKLVYHKHGNIEEKELIKKNFELTSKLKEKYQAFRQLIKNKYYI